MVLFVVRATKVRATESGPQIASASELKPRTSYPGFHPGTPPGLDLPTCQLHNFGHLHYCSACAHTSASGASLAEEMECILASVCLHLLLLQLIASSGQPGGMT